MNQFHTFARRRVTKRNRFVHVENEQTVPSSLKRVIHFHYENILSEHQCLNERKSEVNN